VGRGHPDPQGRVWRKGYGPSPEFFLHFHVEKAHFWGILDVNLLYEKNSKNASKSNVAYTSNMTR